MAILVKYSLNVAPSFILLPMLLNMNLTWKLFRRFSSVYRKQNYIAQLTQFLQTEHLHFSLVPYLYSYELFISLKNKHLPYTASSWYAFYLMIAKSKQSSRYLKAYPQQRQASTNYAGKKMDIYFPAYTKTYPKCNKTFKANTGKYFLWVLIAQEIMPTTDM